MKSEISFEKSEEISDFSKEMSIFLERNLVSKEFFIFIKIVSIYYYFR